LLGGGSDNDESESQLVHNQRLITNSNPIQYRDLEAIDSGDSRSDISNDRQNSIYLQHRLQPQRGPVDEVCDSIFDGYHALRVPLKKQGRQDGVYLFGMRIMKIYLQKENNIATPRVFVGQKVMLISEFLSKFERVEILRKKGFDSAVLMTNMMGKALQ